MDGAKEASDDQKIGAVPSGHVAEQKAEPAGNQTIPDYPTAQQIEQSWNAYKVDGKRGILEFLRRQREERTEKREAQGN